MKRDATLTVAVVAAVGLLGMSLYAFASPWPIPEDRLVPAVSQEAPPSAEADATQTSDIPEPDPNSPHHTDIPGCVCHSDDPEIVAEHAEYRMNQCFGCHDGGVPTGQK